MGLLLTRCSEDNRPDPSLRSQGGLQAKKDGRRKEAFEKGGLKASLRRRTRKLGELEGRGKVMLTLMGPGIEFAGVVAPGRKMFPPCNGGKERNKKGTTMQKELPWMQEERGISGIKKIF